MVFAKTGPNYTNIVVWKEWLFKEPIVPVALSRTARRDLLDFVSYQRYGDFSKYFDPAATEQWPTGVLAAQTAAAVSYTAASPTQLWRAPRSAAKPMPLPYYSSDDPCVYTVSPRFTSATVQPEESWREAEAPEPGPAAAVATPYGTISLRLHDRVRVDMTVDKAVRIINFKNNIVICLSGCGSAAALLHPNGRVYQYGSRVEILAHDTAGNNKFAKMWYKGVSFTSEQCALVYLVDAAGTRTTTDNFSDMGQDFSLPVFYNDSRHGPSFIQEAVSILQSSQYWMTDEGIENWIINNVRVSQTQDGLVRVARNSNKYQLRTSPSNGTASLTTPFLHCTASMGQTSHLFVRRGERRMHYDGASFIVRNAGHSAGFDEKNQLKVY